MTEEELQEFIKPKKPSSKKELSEKAAKAREKEKQNGEGGKGRSRPAEK